MKTKSPISIAADIFIKLALLGILIVWCFQLLHPFAGVVLWGIILALALAPIYHALNKLLNNKRKWTAAIFIVVGLLVLIVPSFWLLESSIEGARDFRDNLENGTLTVPPPSDKVKDWPVIGEKAYDKWEQASVNLEAFTSNNKDQITKITKTLLDHILGMGATILQFVLSTIIAGILLATKGTEDAAKKIFMRLLGPAGEKVSELASRTVSSVTRGVLGVALIQALLVGIGFLLAGVPYAGIWALLVFMLALLQIPPLVIVVPVCIYLFSTMGTGAAILWTVYLVVAGISDNVFKPLLLAKGAPVPMLVILLGVIGGFMLSGFIGLFTGAIALSLGYKLFLMWLEEEQVKALDKDNRKLTM